MRQVLTIAKAIGDESRTGRCLRCGTVNCACARSSTY